MLTAPFLVTVEHTQPTASSPAQSLLSGSQDRSVNRRYFPLFDSSMALIPCDKTGQFPAELLKIKRNIFQYFPLILSAVSVEKTGVSE